MRLHTIIFDDMKYNAPYWKKEKLYIKIIELWQSILQNKYSEYDYNKYSNI